MSLYYQATEALSMGWFTPKKPKEPHTLEVIEVEDEIVKIKRMFKKDINEVRDKTRKAREATEIILEAEKKGDGVLNTFLATGGDKRL